ncbi:hypothetical protein NPX13_g8171 [Xylaria arbuscula]|uniref:Uncharacterized protein n=1 Tax=Xylaria arbuscula TaxID=114810 RepID=A0A9W8N8N9_9PEZI|nr:hypothetical protein NPX13_g8171 [Xylaria arbuscula]
MTMVVAAIGSMLAHKNNQAVDTNPSLLAAAFVERAIRDSQVDLDVWVHDETSRGNRTESPPVVITRRKEGRNIGRLLFSTNGSLLLSSPPRRSPVLEWSGYGSQIRRTMLT